MRKLKLFLDAKAANTPPRGISKASRVIFSVLTLLLLSIGQVWGEVVSGTTYDVKASTSIPSGWTASGNFATSGGGWLYLTYADNYVQTDEFCQNGFTSIKIKARKYGGPSDAQGVISVEWFEKGGSSTVLATTTPSGTGLADITLSDLATVTGNKEGYIKISCKGASSNKGSGISEVTITYTSGNCAVADPYTVSFSTGAGNPSVASQTETAGGAGITLPAGPTPICFADGWAFAGWKETSAVTEQTTTAPTLLAAGTNYKPSDDVTLYAVYKKTETGEVTDLDFTEGFETKAAGSTYNSTVTIETTESDCNVGWSIYYGCVSTNDKIAGSNSAQMRWYSSAKNNIPYVLTTTPISGLQSVNFKARVSNTAVKMSLWYSTNGEDWTLSDVNQETFTAANTAYDFSATISGTVGTNYYVKIGEDGGTAPSSGNYKLIIDAVQFNYKAGASTTYYLSAPSCCEKHAITIATGIENGSVEADLAEACEGTAVTLTFTPALNYHLSAWTLNGDDQDIAENTFEMPGADVTVSATFAQDACEPLGTPSVTVSGKEYPYDAVQLAWTAIEHADAYKVYIYDNEDNELEHNDAFAGVEYTIGQTLSASTTYKYSVQAVSNTPATYCPSEAATGSFVTEALPTAHLTLIALGEEQQASGDYAILTPFALPSTAAACSKTFMGWDANSECAMAPTYAKGAEFTFQNTTGVTLYAVYADETPGEATLTKLGSNYAPTAGDKLVIVGVDGDDQYALYRETQSSSYVKNWAFDNNVATVAADAKKYVILEAATNGKFYLGDATNGYVYSSGSNNLSVDASNKTAWTIASSQDGFTFNQGRYLSCRSDLQTENKHLYRLAGSTPAGIYHFDVYKYAVSASTFSNYSTTCVAAPIAESASASIAVAAAGGEGTLGVSYENVNLAGVEVALFNNEACTEAFDGGWLTATIDGDDKHIAYTIAENTAYAARTAYIKLTAPETSGAANPAVVVIPVEQAKKPAVFASLADLVAAELASGTEVTVSFSNVMITEVYETNAGYRYGLYLNVKDKDGENDIELFYNKQGDSEQVPDTWVKNGYVSATNLVTTWTEYKGQWELAMQGATWSWENGDITYGAPKAVSSVVVSGEPTKKAYVDGEKFNPAGLTVTVNYTIGEPDVIDAADADWVYETSDVMALNLTSIKVKATYNTVTSENFYEVTDLTVNPISNKTIAQFIADEGGRCYLEGIVSGNINTTYGNFDLQDETGTIYVYGSDVFEDHGVALGDKVKVIAEEYLLYKKAGNPDKDEALNVKFVSVKKATTIAIEDINMEVGDELLLSNIVATVTPAAAQSAEIAYEVSEGSAVEIEEGKIKAITEGEATITASIAEGEGYLAGSKTFTVTVTAPDLRHIANASAFEAVSGDMTPTDIKYEAFKGDGTNAPVLRSSDNPVAIRLYKPATTGGTGNYLTLTAKVGCTIDQVQVTFSGTATAAYCKDDEALPTEAFVTGQSELLTAADLNAQSVSIVNLKNGSIDVNAIKVWYTGDALAVDHYFLDGTYETTFEQNGTFDYTGLEVYASYDAGETITEPVEGFTVQADLSTAGDKKAEVYLNEVKIAEYDITVTAGKENPALAYSPASETITAGDAWSAPTLSNTFSVSPITYSSDKESVATVDENGVITLAGGYGTAVITAHFDETAAYIESEATYTITVNKPAPTPTSTIYRKVTTTADITDGEYLIVYEGDATHDAVVFDGSLDNDNIDVAKKVLAVEIENDEIAGNTELDAAVFTIDVTAGSLQSASGLYIGRTNYDNGMDKSTTEAYVNTFAITDGAAVITGAGGCTLRYNYAVDQLRFRYYKSGQQAIQLYKKETVTPPTPDYGSYQRNVTSGNYGTICLPQAGTIEGATLFEIASFENGMIYMDEVGSTMEAGKPYIFQATADQLNVTYTSGAQVAAGKANGLHGFYNLENMATDAADKLDLDEDQGNYILYQNAYWLVSGRAAYINNFRAYIKLVDITSTAQAPGRRRVAMAVHGEQTATGMDALNATDAPVKMIIDGQMYILRGEKMYDATGRLVK